MWWGQCSPNSQFIKNQRENPAAEIGLDDQENQVTATSDCQHLLSADGAHNTTHFWTGLRKYICNWDQKSPAKRYRQGGKGKRLDVWVQVPSVDCVCKLLTGVSLSATYFNSMYGVPTTGQALYGGQGHSSVHRRLKAFFSWKEDDNSK